MPANEHKYWPPRKKHVHILGEVRRVKHGTGTISALFIYEESVCRGHEPAELPPLRARALIGACGGLICTICKAEISWDEPPSEAYQRLMLRYEKVSYEHV